MMKYSSTVQPFTPLTNYKIIHFKIRSDSPVWFFLSFHLLCWDNCRGAHPRKSRTENILNQKWNKCQIKLFPRSHLTSDLSKFFLTYREIKYRSVDSNKKIFSYQKIIFLLLPALRLNFWMNYGSIWFLSGKKLRYYFNLSILLPSLLVIHLANMTEQNQLRQGKITYYIII